MSRQIEQHLEERAKRERDAVLAGIYGGLEAAVEYAGGVLCGLSVSFRGGDTLLVLRADFPAGRMVAFVGSADLAGVFAKAPREARAGRLRWKTDKWDQRTS